MQALLLKLEQVQELDTKIFSLRKKINEMPSRLAGFDAEIKQHQTKHDEKKKALEELEKNLRQQKGALELNETRSKRSQEKLDLIKTSQEYSALQKEVESLKKNSGIILEAADKIEKECEVIRKEMEEIQKVISEIAAKRESEAGLIAGETDGFKASMETLLTERNALVTDVDKRHLSAYEKVRDSRLGVGIVRAEGGSCKGCNVRIPPQMYNEIIRGTEIHTCPSCRRLLVHHRDTMGTPAANDPIAAAR